jgi:hypothetical protein
MGSGKPWIGGGDKESTLAVPICLSGRTDKSGGEEKMAKVVIQEYGVAGRGGRLGGKGEAVAE